MPAARARSWLLPAVALAVIAAGGFWVLGNPGSGGPAGRVAADVERAQLRLDARDYRAALAEATSALTSDPANTQAARIRAAAEAPLAVLDGLLATAREALAAGDSVAAARALASAQALAPGDAQVSELAARLAATPAATPTASPAAPVPVAAQAGERRDPARQVPGEPAPPSPSDPARPAVTTGSSEPTAPPTTAADVPPALPVADPLPLNPPAQREPPPPERRPVPVDSPSPPAATPAAPARESDEVLVRRALTTYERAIEGKDVALFRSVLPNLSGDEERRLRASFAQIERQEIEIRVVQLTITGDTAQARVARVDTVQSGGRPQTSRSTQTIRLARRGDGWIIVELGRFDPPN